LNAEITYFTTGAQTTNALIGGSLDAGLADLLQIALAVIRGVPLTIFAGATLYTSASPATVLAVKKSSTFEHAKEFEGQIIGLPGLDSLPECSIGEWLTANGADQPKVRFVEMPTSQRPRPLTAVPSRRASSPSRSSRRQAEASAPSPSRTISSQRSSCKIVGSHRAPGLRRTAQRRTSLRAAPTRRRDEQILIGHSRRKYSNAAHVTKQSLRR
jgi:hypothetical protein